MHGERAESGLAEALLHGPRGRRLLLEFALRSERGGGPKTVEHPFGRAAFRAARRLDPVKPTASIYFRPVDPEEKTFGWAAYAPEPERVSPEEVARLLGRVVLAEPEPESLRLCLADSVAYARYWQDPDGEDVLAATEPMRAALRRVAEHVAASPVTDWWSTRLDTRSQRVVRWDDAPPIDVPENPLVVLRAARARELEGEARAARERPSDPAASFSGTWWSTPTRRVVCSTRAMEDGGPAGVWFVEDDLGWKEADAIAIDVAEGLCVYEIDGAEAWAELCRRFPLEQTAQKRQDWFQTTGRAGRWVVPDWAGVAEHYDAVHMQVAAYLAAAGTAIPVDDDSASVIAGWAPDETWWFTSEITYAGAPVRWIAGDRRGDFVWRKRVG